MNQALFDGALDVVLQSGYIVRVTVQIENQVDQTFYCCPAATAADIRRLLRARNENLQHADGTNGARFKELRITDHQGKHVFGLFEKSPPSLDTLLNCEIVARDPHLFSLFQILKMTETERDRMMQCMITPRLPQKCPGRHILEYSNVLILTNMVCDVCEVRLETRPDWWGCRECNFDLCRECHDGDQGDDVTMLGTDPYDEVAALAKHIGLEVAKGERGRRLGRWSGRRVVYWNTTNWGWVRPSVFQKPGRLTSLSPHQFPMEQEQLLLAPGVRLVIRFNERLRRVVSAAIAPETASSASDLLPGETDEVLPNGANFTALRNHGRKLLSERVGWERVMQVLSKKFEMRWKGCRGGGTIKHRDLVLGLIEFELDKVRYELSAVADGVNGHMSVHL
ncbi:expressed unknown protein [Seminavis robusta]|uniref:Uncharacterized protein n=1 Tax=Seminavis robusta TaxID=568900 RepID=A0A9N8F2Q7_9STRA|nr:expressed unknown protein [Seminavis robusta]|eukprot:Sro2891_g339580.1 n/a (395) ;mRNA; f:4352-5536